MITNAPNPSLFVDKEQGQTRGQYTTSPASLRDASLSFSSAAVLVASEFDNEHYPRSYDEYTAEQRRKDEKDKLCSDAENEFTYLHNVSQKGVNDFNSDTKKLREFTNRIIIENGETLINQREKDIEVLEKNEQQFKKALGPAYPLLKSIRDIGKGTAEGLAKAAENPVVKAVIIGVLAPIIIQHTMGAAVAKAVLAFIGYTLQQFSQGLAMI
jgi:hypothetical protein